MKNKKITKSTTLPGSYATQEEAVAEVKKLAGITDPKDRQRHRLHKSYKDEVIYRVMDAGGQDDAERDARVADVVQYTITFADGDVVKIVMPPKLDSNEDQRIMVVRSGEDTHLPHLPENVTVEEMKNVN